MYFYIFRVIITNSMKLLKIKEKLSGAYDMLCSRTNCYHNGGSSSEGLCTDFEYTIGLDDRAEINNVIGGIVLALVVLVICFIWVIGPKILMTILIPEVMFIGVFFLLVVSYLFILKIYGH